MAAAPPPASDSMRSRSLTLTPSSAPPGRTWPDATFLPIKVVVETTPETSSARLVAEGLFPPRRPVQPGAETGRGQTPQCALQFVHRPLGEIDGGDGRKGNCRRRLPRAGLVRLTFRDRPSASRPRAARAGRRASCPACETVSGSS